MNKFYLNNNILHYPKIYSEDHRPCDHEKSSSSDSDFSLTNVLGENVHIDL